MKVSQETGSETNIAFGRALMPSNLGMHTSKAAFISFRSQWRQSTSTVYYQHSLKYLLLCSTEETHTGLEHTIGHNFHVPLNQLRPVNR